MPVVVLLVVALGVEAAADEVDIPEEGVEEEGVEEEGIEEDKNIGKAELSLPTPAVLSVLCQCVHVGGGEDGRTVNHSHTLCLTFLLLTLSLSIPQMVSHIPHT